MTELLTEVLASCLVTFITTVLFLLLFPRALGKKSGQSAQDDPVTAESILRLIEQGQRIQAIKAVRAVSGLSLKEALTVVKEVEAGNTALIARYFHP